MTQDLSEDIGGIEAGLVSCRGRRHASGKAKHGVATRIGPLPDRKRLVLVVRTAC